MWSGVILSVGGLYTDCPLSMMADTQCGGIGVANDKDDDKDDDNEGNVEG